VIDRGRVIAEGTPEDLKAAIGGSQVDLVLRDAADLDAAAELLSRVSGTDPEVDREARRLSAPVHDQVTSLTELLRALEDHGIEADDVAVRRPTLDEVFLQLTGEAVAA
jgi:ABC-2 type transport system ATP-binding protein